MSVPLSAADIPRFARGVRLRHDEARGQWVQLAPEGVFQPDPVSVEILKKIDGLLTLGTIVDELASTFSADPARVGADVRAFLAGLVEKGLIAVDPPPSKDDGP